MKFAATAAAATFLATGASAQLSSPLQLLQYASRLLTTECREAVTGLVTSSELAQCIQVQNLLPILNNANTSVIPNVNDYLVDLCAAEPCSQSTIDNATETVTTACATDLNRFGVSTDIVEFIMNAYPTAREVVCLSTNDTELVSSNSTSNATSPTNVTQLCPTALLYKAEEYLGVNFTNTYIDSLLLGANATAYQQLLSIPRNGSIISEFACNDCVAAGLEVVIRDYPQIETITFDLTLGQVQNFTNYTLPGVNATEANKTKWSVVDLYDGFCDVDILANSSLPASINWTAYNSTAANTTMSTTSMATGVASSTGVVSRVASATSAAATSAISSVVAPITSRTAPIASASSAIASGVVSILPVPSQAIGSAVAPVAAPTKRWMKWE